MAYDYDLNGRLRALRYPGQLVQSPNNARDSVVYGYDSQTGSIASVSDLLGNVVSYTHDNAGQLARLDVPGTVREWLTYDGAGRVTSDTIRNVANLLQRAATFVYDDARGKITTAIDGATKKDTLVASYSGLGFLVASKHRETGIDYRGFTQNFASVDTMAYDALGNVIRSTTLFANATSAIEDARALSLSGRPWFGAGSLRTRTARFLR